MSFTGSLQSRFHCFSGKNMVCYLGQGISAKLTLQNIFLSHTCYALCNSKEDYLECLISKKGNIYL